MISGVVTSSSPHTFFRQLQSGNCVLKLKVARLNTRRHNYLIKMSYATPPRQVVFFTGRVPRRFPVWRLQSVKIYHVRQGKPYTKLGVIAMTAASQ